MNYYSLQAVPKDVLTDILARVASSSLRDLCNAKLVSKLLHELAEDNYVFQHVSMDRIPAIPWWPLSQEAVSFLQRCQQNHNPEALYRLGMVEFFRNGQFTLGRTMLESAASRGHDEASYVLGMILICGDDDESRLQGIKLLNELDKRLRIQSSSRSYDKRISECRKNCKSILGRMWNKCCLCRQQKVCTNCDKNSTARILQCRSGWDSMDEYDEDAFNCKLCKWDHEFSLFAKC